MIRALVLLSMAVLPLARCHKIHEHMTREEMLSVFHTGHESVPSYEIVPVLHTIHKRSTGRKTEVHLKAFGTDISLSLKPTRGLLSPNQLPMWTVTKNDSHPDGLSYERVLEVDTDIGDIYQDTRNMASILLHRDANGKVLVDGNIGSELVIRPLPERVLQEVVSKSTILQRAELLPNVTGTKKDLKHTSHHVVFKKFRKPTEDEYSDYALMEPDHLAKRYRSKRSSGSRSKREAPYVIYPEILCIVDYDGYRLHGGDNVQIKRYFVSFWNGVDLRYKLLKGPKIRISIAGIIISRGRDATPYLERNRVGRDAIDSAAALTDMGKYLFRERRLPVYDIAVAVTKYDMCRRRKGGRCTKGTAGFAYVGGACVVNKRLEKVNSVAIIEDTGGFSGIIVAAHEVGHLLGAVHDGSPPPSYLGGPGAEKCRWEDGYIMSDLRHTEKGFKWSHCSVSSFHHFLNGDTATCLYNAPHEDEALPRVLPGKLLSLDAQCRKDRGTSACFKDDRVCAQLFCFDAGSGYCVAYRPAAEGSPCGDGQYCLNGKCVAEHENIIPDYTQNIPTYVRRDGTFGPPTHNRPIFAQYNSTDYRYPWEGTTYSSPKSKFKLNPFVSNLLASSSTTTVNVKRVTPSAPVYRYTHTTANNLLAINDKTRASDNNKSNSNNGNGDKSDSNNEKGESGGNRSTTTSKKSNRYNFNFHYNVTPTPKAGNNPNDVNYPKIIPFKHKSTTSVTQFSPTTVGVRNGLRNNGRETGADECTDVGPDCLDLIDRLGTWLCHLQSVKSRCCASLKTIHEYMTPEEVMSVFHTDHETVPDYAVVPIQHTAHRRSLDDAQEVQLKAFDRDIKLYLHPTEGILASKKTPVWTVSSDPSYPEGLKYKLIPNAMRDLGNTFHDLENTASVLMKLDSNKRLFLDGVIGAARMVIRSLPKRILRHILYNTKGLYKDHNATMANVTEDDDLAYTYHHVVYKIPETKGKQYKDFKLTDPLESSTNQRHKREVPDVIYPEILVIMDNSEYELVGKNLEHAKRYIVSFWNGVDLRYRLLNNPRIRFNIAGIVIALDSNATSYMERNRLSNSSLLVDVDVALREMGDYIYRETRFPIGFFDIAITMTQLDLCNKFGDYCDGSTLGYAYVAGACNRQDDIKTSEMAGIVEDNGGFSGIIPTAHEIGHLIGARHDGNPQYANDCPAFDGYIMTSGLMLHENGFEWSNCTINSFYKFLNEERAQCLYNEPVMGPPVSRILPGKLMSLDYQCKKVHGHGTKACNKDATACTRLNCLIPGTMSACSALSPAAEGSSCGDGVFCLNGKCVLEGSYTKSHGKKAWSHFKPLFKLQRIMKKLGR
ncbi:hypothetical protein KPH14_002355 [Odynerus spinipes]|uniref:Peptidase M12B domain-containing protein n=1 Tax=Odynerus spinipes TaxID=1348599 RepID=A0AAD9VP75_9HYME|nr:hypothetical protein KPH14_002355 [Odynerus spinipes]